MRPFMTEALEAIADRFHPREGIKSIRSLGSGNVNETFLVTHPTPEQHADPIKIKIMSKNNP